METRTVQRIFECYVLEGAKKTAKRFGVSVYLANAAWQRWCSRLERKPKEHRQCVFIAAQMSVELAMSQFGYNKAEVLRICLHWKKGLAAKEKQAEAAKVARAALIGAAKRLFKRYAPVGTLTGSIFEDVDLYISSALADVSDDNWEWPRPPVGEFTPHELSFGKRRSDYRWVYDTLSVMQPDHVRTCFPKAGEDFLRACKLTREGRIQRRRVHLEKPGTEQRTRPSRGRKDPWVKASKTHYLPKPTVSPGVIAKSFADYLALLPTP
jgi:hypothetical protein